MPDYASRNFEERGFTVGIGGCVVSGRHSSDPRRPKMSTFPVLTQIFLTFDRPVGSGKTALTLALCQKLRKEYNIGAGPSLLRALGQM